MKVKEIKKTVYEAIDGQQFDTESEAKEHEIEIFASSIPIETVATTLKKYCENKKNCEACPFEDKDFYECECKLKREFPVNWDI